MPLPVTTVPVPPKVPSPKSFCPWKSWKVWAVDPDICTVVAVGWRVPTIMWVASRAATPRACSDCCSVVWKAIASATIARPTSARKERRRGAPSRPGSLAEERGVGGDGMDDKESE